MNRILCFAVFSAFFLCACSTPFVTNTSRSNVEQMLISSAIEHGIGKIDFSNYSKIKVDYSSATSGSQDTRKVTIWLTSEIGKASMQNYQKLYEQIPAGSGTLEIDISAVNTSYYFVISADADPNIHATINKVWLE